MNESNTNTQAGRDLQSLQPQGSQTQQTSSNFQGGSGVNLSTGNTANVLNQGVSRGNILSVSVANANSQTSVAAPENTPVKNSGVPVFYTVIPVFLFFLALFLIYRRVRRFDNEVLEASSAEEGLFEEIKTVKTKKKRKKPKRPHHH